MSFKGAGVGKADWVWTDEVICEEGEAAVTNELVSALGGRPRFAGGAAGLFLPVVDLADVDLRGGAFVDDETSSSP